MMPRPTTSTLFPYTTLFRSAANGSRRGSYPGTDCPCARGCAARSHQRSSHFAQAPSIGGNGVSGCESARPRSEEHTSELQSRLHLVCRLLLEKKKKYEYSSI